MDMTNPEVSSVRIYVAKLASIKSRRKKSKARSLRESVGNLRELRY